MAVFPGKQPWVAGCLQANAIIELICAVQHQKRAGFHPTALELILSP
jgi:hypothetical protein